MKNEFVSNQYLIDKVVAGLRTFTIILFKYLLPKIIIFRKLVLVKTIIWGS